DDQTYRLPGAGARLVPDVGDALDALVLDELPDGLVQADARLLEGNLVNDDLGARPILVDLGPGAQGDLAAAGAVAVDDPLPAADDAAGREIGAGDQLHQLFERRFRVVDQPDEAVADLAQVVRRDFSRHADGDAVAAVDEQVGELARQDGRLHVP